MQKRFGKYYKILFALLFIIIFLNSFVSAVLNVPLKVKEVAGVGSNGFPISAVVPMPKSQYFNVNNFKVTDLAGNQVPAQFDILNKWWADDNSIRNLKIEFQPTVSAFTTSGTGISTYYLKDSGSGNSISTDLKVSETSSVITIDTGAIKFTVNKNNFNIIDELWHDGNNNNVYEATEEIINSNLNNGGIFLDRFNNPQLDSSRSDVKVIIEEQGPMRVVIRAEALTKFYNTTDQTHGYAVRIYAYNNKPFVKIDYQLQNSPKNPKYWPLYFESMDLDFNLNLESNPSIRFGFGDGTVYTRNKGNGLYIAQEFHNISKIYDMQTSSVLQSKVYSQTNLKSNSIRDSFIDISDSQKGVSASTRYFWQTWPNGLAIDNNNKLSIQLFPEWSSQWLDNKLKGWYWLEDMQHTYKEVLLNFHSAGVSDKELVDLTKTFEFHPVAVIPTSWYYDTKATLDLGGIIPNNQLISVSSDDRINKYDDYDFNAKDVPGNYKFGWDNFYINRKVATGGAGGWPNQYEHPSGIITTEDPRYYYEGEQLVIGEMNIRPHWMAGYNYSTDFTLLKLSGSDVYNGVGSHWRHAGGGLYAPYINTSLGFTTSGDSMPRDDSHGWWYFVEESYYFTSNPWVKDWYKFVAELRKASLDNTPDSALASFKASRAQGHMLAHTLQAYRVTGDMSLINRIYDYYKKYLRDTLDKRSGFRGKGGESGWMAGYLNHALISYAEEIKNSNSQAFTDMFQFIAGYNDWNYHYSNFGHYLYLDEVLNNNKMTYTYGGYVLSFADVQAWYYMNTGKQKYFAHLNDFIDEGIKKVNLTVIQSSKTFVRGGSTTIGGNVNFNKNEWFGAYAGRLPVYARTHAKTDTTPPAKITDLIASINGNNVLLTWTPPSDAVKYIIVYSNMSISESYTTDTAFINWWAADAIPVTTGSTSSIAITPKSTNKVYAAIFSFDNQDNMASMSNVAFASSSIAKDSVSPSTPANLKISTILINQTYTGDNPVPSWFDPSSIGDFVIDNNYNTQTYAYRTSDIYTLKITENKIFLEWSPSTDNTGIVGYKILRDGEPVWAVSGTNFTDRFTSFLEPHSYEVIAIDTQSQESLPAPISYNLKSCSDPSIAGVLCLKSSSYCTGNIVPSNDSFSNSGKVCCVGAGACKPKQNCLTFANAVRCSSGYSCSGNDISNQANDLIAGESCCIGTCTVGAVDVDGDGYDSTLDCDDNDIAVNPGAIEGPNTDATCSDGIDNNCDGKIDIADSGCSVSYQTCSQLGGTEKCSSTQNCNGNTITGASDLQIGETCCQGTCENVVSDSMILYYPFDRGDINLSTKIILDRSGFENNGIMLGARFLKTTNHSGAMIFNNTDYITCGNKQSLQLNKSFTLSAWVYPADLSRWNTIIEVGDSINNRYGMRAYLDSLYAVTDNTYLTSYYNGISEKQWQHVAVSYNSSSNTKQYFVNGALMRTTSNEIDSPSPNGACQIGHSNADLNFGFFQGIIDEVRIYNYPLSSTEISNIYNGKDYHDADADKNGFIEISEMFSYVDNWFKGNIEMNNLAVAVHIWKKGYSYISNLPQPGKICIDDDTDGYNTTLNCGMAIDCDDNDISVNPGAAEICTDGIDNNCDGQIDEGCGGCTDDDSDGYNSTSCGGNDCDDNDISVNPGATEGPSGNLTCSDGKDNDCDNLVDSNDPNCVSLQTCFQLGGAKCLITQTCTGAIISAANDVNYGSGETCCNATTGTCQNLLSCSAQNGNICSGNSYCPNPSLNKINANDTLPVVQGKTCCKIPCQQAVSYLSCSAQSGTICQTSDYKCSGNVIPSNDTTYSWSALMCCIGNCTKGTTATCSSQGGNICAINQYCNGSSELLNAGDVKYGYDSATGRGGETCCIGQCASLTTATDFAGRNWYLLPWLESETRAYSKNLAQRESDYLTKYGENWAGLKNGNCRLQNPGDWRWETIDVLPDDTAERFKFRFEPFYPGACWPARWGLEAGGPVNFVWWPDSATGVTDVYIVSDFSIYHLDPITKKRTIIGKPEHNYGAGLRDGVNDDAIMSTSEADMSIDRVTGRIYFNQPTITSLADDAYTDKNRAKITETMRYVDKLLSYKCTDVNPNQVYYLPAFLDWHNLYQQVKGPNGCNLALVINSTTGQRDSIWYVGSNFNLDKKPGMTNYIPGSPSSENGGRGLTISSDNQGIWFSKKSSSVSNGFRDTGLEYASLFDIFTRNYIKDLNLNQLPPKEYSCVGCLGDRGDVEIGYDDNFYVAHTSDGSFANPGGSVCGSGGAGRSFLANPNTGDVTMLYNSVSPTGAWKKRISPIKLSDGPADANNLRFAYTTYITQSPRTGAIIIGGGNNAAGIRHYHDGFLTTLIAGVGKDLAETNAPRNNSNWNGWKRPCGGFASCDSNNKVIDFTNRNGIPDIAPDGSMYMGDGTSDDVTGTRIVRIYRTDWSANQPVGGYYKSLFPDSKLEQLRIDFANKYISNYYDPFTQKYPTAQILINGQLVTNRPNGGAGVYDYDVANGALTINVDANANSPSGTIKAYRWNPDNKDQNTLDYYGKTQTFTYSTKFKWEIDFLVLEVNDTNGYRGYDVVVMNLTNSSGVKWCDYSKYQIGGSNTCTYNRYGSWVDPNNWYCV